MYHRINDIENRRGEPGAPPRRSRTPRTFRLAATVQSAFWINRGLLQARPTVGWNSANRSYPLRGVYTERNTEILGFALQSLDLSDGSSSPSVSMPINKELSTNIWQP